MRCGTPGWTLLHFPKLFAAQRYRIQEVWLCALNLQKLRFLLSRNDMNDESYNAVIHSNNIRLKNWESKTRIFQQVFKFICKKARDKLGTVFMFRRTPDWYTFKCLILAIVLTN